MNANLSSFLLALNWLTKSTLWSVISVFFVVAVRKYKFISTPDCVFVICFSGFFFCQPDFHSFLNVKAIYTSSMDNFTFLCSIIHKIHTYLIWFREHSGLHFNITSLTPTEIISFVHCLSFLSSFVPGNLSVYGLTFLILDKVFFRKLYIRGMTFQMFIVKV